MTERGGSSEKLRRRVACACVAASLGACALLVAWRVGAQAPKDLNEKEAASLIARVFGFDRKPKDVVKIKEMSAATGGALVTADVEGVFRFEKRAGKWRVAEVRTGDNKWEDVETIVRALNAEKAARARAELETVWTALEAFRRERGFYVVATDSATLFDHLAPRYVARILRVDPWHHPYRYAGDRDSFVISSDGTDGKSGTADDISISSR